METRDEVLTRLLDDATRHIEFNGFLTNHAKHAVIALAGLGASTERIEAYYRGYSLETPYGYGLEPARRAATTLHEGDWQAELGRRRDYPALARFFAERVSALGLDEALTRYLPTLAPGVAGALLHGAIHLGWALDVERDAMVVEGLAYLAYTYVSVRPERAGPAVADRTPWDSIARLARAWHDGGLAERIASIEACARWRPEAGFHPELADSGTQLRVARLLAAGPPELRASPRWLELADPWPALHEAAARLYLTESGDFVLLHLITGLHALEVIARRLPAIERARVTANAWRAVAAVLLARDRLPTLAELDVVAELPPARAGAADWDEVVARALREREEHNVKLVYVMRRHWARFGRGALWLEAARRFTPTPVVPLRSQTPSS